MSDSGDELPYIKQRKLSIVEVNTLNIETRMCCISYYYHHPEDDFKYCTDCFFVWVFLFTRAVSVREHKTSHYHVLWGNLCVAVYVRSLYIKKYHAICAHSA